MTERTFWMSKAHRLAMRRNLACWLDLFLPAAFTIALIGAVSLLVLRILRVPVMPLWVASAIVLLAAGLASCFYSRRRFFSTDDALTRLDETGRLHNRLTAAQAGVGDWPAARSVKDETRWNWPRLFGPLGLSIIVLIGAAWVDVPNPKGREHATQPPLAWGQIESWLQTLEQSQLVEPEPLQKLRAQLDELRQQPPENWYNQSSLEASDTLREQTEQALKSMLDNLQKSEDTVAAAAKLGETAPPGELKGLNESLQKALHGLEMGNLPLNKELLNDLKKIDPTKLKQLNASQLAEMRAKLKAGVRVCEKCVGPSIRAGEKIATAQSGGEGGGGGPAPLTLKETGTNLRTTQSDSVSNEDVSHAALGDIVGVNKGKHDVKKNAPKGPQAGGAIESTGQGGEAIWRDSLTPEEREVLQRYFK